MTLAKWNSTKGYSHANIFMPFIKHSLSISIKYYKREQKNSREIVLTLHLISKRKKN